MILIKHCRSAQVASLYTGLFCKSIDQLFRTNGLAIYLDYGLTGTTYIRGAFVYIDIELYTKEAVELAKKVRALNINLDQTSIGAGIAKINAETKRFLTIPSGSSALEQELKELHAQPWQDINNISIINTKGARRNAGALAIANDKPFPVRKVTISILLNAELITTHPEILPLAHQISGLIMENAEMVLTYRYGFHRTELRYAKNPRQKALVSSVLNTSHPDGPAPKHLRHSHPL